MRAIALKNQYCNVYRLVKALVCMGFRHELPSYTCCQGPISREPKTIDPTCYGYI